MSTVSVKCVNDSECDADIEITYSIYGRYLRATMQDPEEFPEIDIEEIPVKCDECGHEFSVQELMQLHDAAEQKVVDRGGSGNGSRYHADDDDDGDAKYDRMKDDGEL